jgi:ATP-dependent DNA helicase HFM1/MER3
MSYADAFCTFSQSSSLPEELNNRDEADSEPIQLPNGKWQCNHACSGGVLTKAGKPCTHRYCREGLDKPRRRCKKRAASDEADEIPSTVKSTRSSSKCSGGKRRKLTKDTVSSHFTVYDAQVSSSVVADTHLDSSDVEWVDLTMMAQDEAGTASCFGRPERSGNHFGGEDVKISRVRNNEALGEEDFGDDPFEDFDPASIEGILAESSFPPLLLDSRGKPGDGLARMLNIYPHDTFKIASKTPESGKRILREASRLLSIPSSPSRRSQGGREEDVREEADSSIDVSTAASYSNDKFRSADTRSSPEIITKRAICSDGAIKREQHRLQTGRADEPKWVNEFDPDLLDMLRGYVKFV